MPQHMLPLFCGHMPAHFTRRIVLLPLLASRGSMACYTHHADCAGAAACGRRPQGSSHRSRQCCHLQQEAAWCIAPIVPVLPLAAGGHTARCTDHAGATTLNRRLAPLSMLTQYTMWSPARAGVAVRLA